MRKQLKASYTVEAAFIVPLCTMVIILLIGQTLFYRDVLAAERVAMCAATEGGRYRLVAASLGKDGLNYNRFAESGILKNNGTGRRMRDEEEIEEYAAELLKGKLWFATGGSITADIQGDNVTVSISVDAADSVKGLFRYGMFSLFHRKVSVTVPVQDIPTDNRLVTAAWDTGMRIEGFSEFLEKIQGLLGKLIG